MQIVKSPAYAALIERMKRPEKPSFEFPAWSGTEDQEILHAVLVESCPDKSDENYVMYVPAFLLMVIADVNPQDEQELENMIQYSLEFFRDVFEFEVHETHSWISLGE